MKTQVETYIIEETQELIYDNEKLDQWNQRVEELGLIGQTKIQAKEKSPIPFLHMKATTVAVFETLCPRKVKVQEYDKTPIPVEILDLVALSNREHYFTDVQIWYDDKTPDPACVGLIGEYTVYDRKYGTIAKVKTESEAIQYKSHPEYYGLSFSISAHYLIGRWADVKLSLSELATKAKTLFIASEKSEITKRIRDEQRRMEDVEHTADVKFGFVEGSLLPF